MKLSLVFAAAVVVAGCSVDVGPGERPADETSAVGTKKARPVVARGSDFDGDGRADVALAAAEGSARVLVYPGGFFGLAPAPTWTIPIDVGAHGMLGPIAPAGDVDGDGYADLVVAMGADDDAYARAFVFRGGARGIATTPSTALASPTTAFGYFATAVSGLGDVNGDGYGDVVVRHFSVLQPGSGPPASHSADRLYVYAGSPKGLGAAPATIVTGNPGATMLDAAAAGDVNGDGFADLLVHDQRDLLGLVEVYLGGPGGIGAAPSSALRASDAAYAPTFGVQMAGVGDVDADGFDDVVIYAERAPTAPAGAAPFVLHVFLGSKSGLGGSPSATIAPPSDVTDGQATVAAAGDVNGDGKDDVVVGVFGTKAVAAQLPVLVYPGARGGLAPSPSERLANPGLGFLTGSDFGRIVAGVGDVNGDSLADLLVGPYDRVVYSPTSLIGIAFVDRTMFAHLGTLLGPAPGASAALWSNDPTFAQSIAAVP